MRRSGVRLQRSRLELVAIGPGKGLGLGAGHRECQGWALASLVDRILQAQLVDMVFDLRATGEAPHEVVALPGLFDCSRLTGAKPFEESRAFPTKYLVLVLQDLVVPDGVNLGLD